MKRLIGRKQIAAKIAAFAHGIDREYAGKDLVIVMVLKGALCFVADLIRAMNIPCGIEVITSQSYGAGGAVRRPVKISGLENLFIENRDVLVVDDIFDSGETLSSILHHLKDKKPRSLKTCVLLSKNVPRATLVRPDYSLFDIANHFVVGYGLDYKEEYRNLSDIFILE
jgi:hypoxanthine phosphoribosyltransferase